MAAGTDNGQDSVTEGGSFLDRLVDGVGRLLSFRAARPAPRLQALATRSPSAALEGDWARLGGDMRRAVGKVVPHGEDAR